MRKMQKIAALGLAGTMALSLAACGGSGDSTADTASTAESTASSTEATAESTGSGDEAVTLNWALCGIRTPLLTGRLWLTATWRATPTSPLR